MKTKPSSLTHEEVRRILNYDPVTGMFTWRVRMGQRGKIGSVAGGKDANGYWKIRIRGRLYAAHRLAWFYAYGVWPDNTDHVSGQRDQNSLTNLRDATHQQNLANVPVSRNNKLGIKGVRRNKGKFEARICANGVYRSLGLFHTPEEAGEAYLKAAKGAFGAFAASSFHGEGLTS